MAIWDVFSKRESRRARQGIEDVFQYEELPEAFRVQVAHIFADVLGRWRDSAGHHSPPSSPSNQWWNEIHHIVAREKGYIELNEQGRNPFEKCCAYLFDAPTTDALDLIEVAFNYVHTHVRKVHHGQRALFGLVDPDRAIDELNGRFREHRIGYEFANGEIIRVDSKYLHAETVKPALHLLQGAGASCSGPLEEFLKAHERYRKGELKEAVADALKAFESTMKAICTLRKWPFDATKDTAKQLIEIVFKNGLVPPYLQNQFTALRSVLESGVPTVRNKTSGHGQGPTPTIVPDWLAAYALHLAAANIVLLIEANRAMGK